MKKNKNPVRGRPNEREPPRLSGVGKAKAHIDETYRYPVLPSEGMRYDDDDSDMHQGINILEHDGLEDDVYEDPERIGRGYRAHEACWQIFSMVRSPDKIDHAMLYDILVSTHNSDGCVYWGHSYGELYESFARFYELSKDRQAWTPWSTRRLRIFSSAPRIPQWHAHHDPLTFSLIQNLVAACTKQKGELLESIIDPASAIAPKLLPFNIQCQTDIFWKLPQEIRELLMVNLDTDDVLSFRLASRAIAVLELSNTFWASRFSRTSLLRYIMKLEPPWRQQSTWTGIYSIMEC